MQKHYETLGVSSDASPASIRSTYLKLLHIYHPDHNDDPEAARKTAELIEAYSVLSDAQKRADYDRFIAQSSSSTRTAQPAAEPTAQPFQRIVCQTCGRQDATLRSALMYWVFSLILITRRGGKAGIWCERCRAKQALRHSAIAGFLGWWGFPWGPIYTIPALYQNAIGGKQDRTQNALLLRLVGFQLFESGSPAEALVALDSSLELEADKQTLEFANALRMKSGTIARSRFPIFRIFTALPSILTTLIVFVSLGFYFDQPSGYESRYQGTAMADGRTPPKTKTPQREAVNTLIDHLADAVKANATPAGQHQEGATTIREYTLDRSKYVATPFEDIASAIEPSLGDPGANSDGFAASAYFNAKLMAASVSLLNDFAAGRSIDQDVSEVTAVGEDPRIGQWLSVSKYQPDFTALLGALKTMSRQQRTGTSRAARKAEIEQLDLQIDTAKAQISDARSNGDMRLGNSWVEVHNKAVEKHNTLVILEKHDSAIYSEVDLAFNRCMDPNILLSRYEHVDLTSNQSVDNTFSPK